LSRFKAGGVSLKLLWYGFMLTAVLLAPLAVLLGQVLGRELAIVPTAVAVGVLAALVQFLGLARWPFLVPALARKYEDLASSEATREAAVVVFGRSTATSAAGNLRARSSRSPTSPGRSGW
jgi:hypothetical protein